MTNAEKAGLLKKIGSRVFSSVGGRVLWKLLGGKDDDSEKDAALQDKGKKGEPWESTHGRPERFNR